MKKKRFMAALLAGLLMFAPIAGMGETLEAQAAGDTVSSGDARTTESAVQWDSANPGTVTWTAAGDCDAYSAYFYDDDEKRVLIFTISESPSATSGYALDFVSRLRCEDNYYHAKKVQAEIRKGDLRSGSASGKDSIIGKTEDFFEIPENMVVNFETNGGTPIAPRTLGDADRNSTYNGDFVVKGAKTTKEGYTFKGWYLDSALTDNRSIYYGGESKEEIDATELRYSWMLSMVQVYNDKGTNNIEDGMIVMEALYRPEITLYAKWVPNVQVQKEDVEEEDDEEEEDEETVLPAEEGVSRVMSESENGVIEVTERDQATGATITTVQEPSGKITVKTSGQTVNADITIPEGIYIKAADGTQIAISAQALRTYVRPVEVASDMKAKVLSPANAGAKGMRVTTTDPYTLDLTLTHNTALISDLTGGLTFTVEIPQEANVDFGSPVAVVRVHNGIPEILDTTVNAAERKVTFVTDAFSVYAVVNVSVGSPKTGENSNVIYPVILAGISVLTGSMILYKRKKA